MAAASSSLGGGVGGGGGGWRTAFLSLRDETLTTPSFPLPQLLHHLIFAHSPSLLAAASLVPPHEVTSDLMFLMELVARANASAEVDTRDIIPLCLATCQFVDDVCRDVSLEMSSSAWTVLLNSFASIMDSLLRLPAQRGRPLMQCLETIRRLSNVAGRKCSLSENAHLLRFLLHVIASLHQDLMYLYRSLSANQISSTLDVGSKQGSILDVIALAFDMLGETFSASDSSIQVDVYQNALEVLRKVMEVSTSRGLLVEGNAMTSFYVSLLHCLHSVLKDHKCAISDHVSSFVAGLRMFLGYGLTSRLQPQLSCAKVVPREKDHRLTKTDQISDEQRNSNHPPYRPPHLRKRDSGNIRKPKAWEPHKLSNQESAMSECPSSDSDFSDSDGSPKDTYAVRSSKVRVAAIVCLQDLCQADPKLFTTHWITLLPTNEVLKPRKREPTLLSCLLFDPYVKVRIASASTLATMLDRPSHVFLQVAEYRECTKYGSFMPLSSSLGLILIQIHTGILHLIQHEKHSKVVASSFKILMLLISTSPYLRLPGDLLPTVIRTLLAKIEDYKLKNDQSGLLVAAMSCLTAAFSVSPSPTQVRDMLSEEISNGFDDADRKPGVLSTLFHYAEQFTNAIICFEALQALRAVSHNYPILMSACWRRVSAVVYELLSAAVPKESSRSWKGPSQESAGITGEKVLTSSIKVLDECLRAISGFKGTEDLFDDKLLETPFTLECIRTKKVSSAPLYGLEDIKEAKKAKDFELGSEQWSEALRKHIPLVLQHSSAMVRNASITCFAGITSSVFLSLTEEEKNFIISSVVRAALHDEAPQVRSAACRAIGVCSCFPEISRSVEVFERLTYTIEANSRHPLISVRVTASWALANICDSLRHWAGDFPMDQFREFQGAAQLIEVLVECAFRLTKDGDKVKSNAVRALGTISRSLHFNTSSKSNKLMDSHVPSLGSDSKKIMHAISLKGSSPSVSDAYRPFVGDSTWLGRIVQAFLSCVTTGNVKVQWNVCHALSNLFSNETIQLQDMDWARSVFSILLLLLRDSSNFKIRIQAAAALAVPASPREYGNSFPDVVQGVVHIIESLGSEQGFLAPSNFKYRIALERQLTSTGLHLLSLTSSSNHQPLTDFLLRKSSFLEDWLETLSSSLEESSSAVESQTQKKEMISKAIRTLIQLYEASNELAVLQKFDSLRTKVEGIDR